MANVFKTEIRPVPTTYITIDGHTTTIKEILYVLADLDGSCRYHHEVIGISDEVEKILKKRDIIQRSVRGGWYVDNHKAYDIFCEKVRRTRDLPFKKQEKQFYINARKQGYKRQRPTKDGNYLYMFHEHRDNPSEIIVVKVDKVLNARLRIQGEHMNCPVKGFPVEAHWKRVKKFKAKD